MRITSLLRRILGVEAAVVEGYEILADGNLLVRVRPRKGRARCGECCQIGRVHDRREPKRWRHLALGEIVVYLSYGPRRVRCDHCDGVRNEAVPWGASDSRFTWAFEENVGFLAQSMPFSHVSCWMAIAWTTVGSIVSRVVARSRDEKGLVGLRRIGIDEFSYRKRHRYLTVVVDHDRKRVVWAGEGRSAETLKGFFEALGAEGREAIRTVTMDMAAGYIKAVEEALPEARIVFDRFHVQRLASRALDDVRRRLVRALGGPQAGHRVKNLRFLLLRYGPGLELDDLDRLDQVKGVDRRLWRAYQGKEELTAIFDETDAQRAEALLRRWLAWAARSRCPDFVKVGRTIRRHLAGVLEYFQERLTNGLVEGFNNKLRVVARRAYGFHSAGALIAVLFLVAGGITLNPVLPKPTCS